MFRNPNIRVIMRVGSIVLVAVGYSGAVMLALAAVLGLAQGADLLYDEMPDWYGRYLGLHLMAGITFVMWVMVRLVWRGVMAWRRRMYDRAIANLEPEVIDDNRVSD